MYLKHAETVLFIVDLTFKVIYLLKHINHIVHTVFCQLNYCFRSFKQQLKQF